MSIKNDFHRLHRALTCCRFLNNPTNIHRSLNSHVFAQVNSARTLKTSSPKYDVETAAKYIGAGTATSGASGAAAGIGIVFNGFVQAFARNPSMKQELFTYSLIGFALAEAMGFFCLIMAALILFAF